MKYIQENEDGSATVELTKEEVEMLCAYALRRMAEDMEKEYKTAALFKEKVNG